VRGGGGWEDCLGKVIKEGFFREVTELNLKIWEGDWEVVKRSGRDEPIWVVIHMCMEAMLGISLYSYPCLKQAKTLCPSYYCLCLLFNKIGELGRTGSAWKRGVWGEEGEGGEQGREMAQIMYAHMNK
jgi:hypothetical protein